MRCPVVTVVLLLVLAGPLPARAADGVLPVFRESPCRPGVGTAPADAAADAVAASGGRLRCGVVPVPRRYADPAAGTFDLAVVVVEPPTARRADDPVLYLHGGPGGEATPSAAAFARNGPVAPARATILVDQRASGVSQPTLCPRTGDRQLAAVAGDLPPDGLMRHWQAADLECRANLDRQGLTPDMFGTRVTAADMDLVRRALGVERWNLFGVSYGTTVAMTMAALYPDSTRSVVLDSAYPPDPMPVDPATGLDIALSGLFSLCRQDAACTARFPDLEARYPALVAALDADPLRVPVPADLAPRIGRTLVLSGWELEAVLFQLLYARDAYPLLPLLLERVERRDGTALLGLLPRLVAQQDALSEAAYAAVECRDRPGYHVPAIPPAQMARGSAISHLGGLCPRWSPPGPPPLLPDAAAMPVLVLAGSLDPVTPPENGRRTAAAIGPNARLVELPWVGHGVEISHPCGAALVSAFIDRPDGPLDTGCAAQVPPPPVATEVHPAGYFSYIVQRAALETASGGRSALAWPVVLLVVVAVPASLLAGLGWPLARLVRRGWQRSRGRPCAAPVPGMGLLVAANLVQLAWAVALAMAVGQAMAGTPVLLGLGLPAWFGWAAGLPLLAGVMAAGGLLACRARRPVGLLAALAVAAGLVLAGLSGLLPGLG